MRKARWLVLTVGVAGAACGDSAHRRIEADAEVQDGGQTPGASEDAGGGSADADVTQPGDDAGGGETDGGAGGGDACAANGCAPLDPLAPFALDCNNLPANGVCQGGPREVLLVTNEYGWIAMADPTDGHFLGWFKRASAKYNLDDHADYWFATQGPDQCIWTASEDDETDPVWVERWNTDGTYRDQPLKPEYIKLTEGGEDLAVQRPRALAFTRDRVYVASSVGTPNRRITRHTLTGEFDKVVLDDGTDPTFIEVLGDGTMLVSDAANYALRRIPVEGGAIELVSDFDVSSPRQVAYVGEGKVLFLEGSDLEPAHLIDLASKQTVDVVPSSHRERKEGIYPLRGGQWLLTGNDFTISRLDPESSGPSGQSVDLYDDPALNAYGFRYVGRACLSEQFVASRTPKELTAGCVAPPAGDVIFAEDFESGSLTGSGSTASFGKFIGQGIAGSTISVDTASVTGSSRALRLFGHVRDYSADSRLAVRAQVSSGTPVQPTYVSYRLLVDTDSTSLGRLALVRQSVANDYGSGSSALSARAAGGSVVDGNSDASASAFTTTDGNGAPQRAWATVEFRDIDWERRTFDMFVDCKPAGAQLSIPDGYGEGIDFLALFVPDTSSTSSDLVAWFDDILIK